MKHIVNFLFEAGILAKTPRSGFYFMGSGEQSVAEHINRMGYIAYALAMLEGDVDVSKVLQMVLFHDFAEGRTSDLNYVHQRYITVDEERAVEDVVRELPFGEDINNIIKEYEERKSKESLVAKDADNLEWAISLKEQIDIGNTRIQRDLDAALKRLKTNYAQKIGAMILETDAREWYLNGVEDEWWINRKSSKQENN